MKFILLILTTWFLLAAFLTFFLYQIYQAQNMVKYRVANLEKDYYNLIREINERIVTTNAAILELQGNDVFITKKLNERR